MTKRIFQSICAVSLGVLLAALLIISGVNYDYFSTQLGGELSHEAMYIAHGVEQSGLEYLQNLPDSETRVTWIAPDGSVKYDSIADISGMGNHLDRQEIAQALSAGEGRAERRSDTISRRTLYYALRIADGSVIRVASTQLTQLSLIFSMLQPVLVVLGLALAFGGTLALRLSRRITKPFEELDIDHPETMRTYEELRPLTEKLAQQNRQIASQMKKLRQRQTEFESITSAMDEGIIVIDHRADILSCNSGALRLLEVREKAEYRNILSINREESLRSVVREALSGSHSEGALLAGGRYCRITGSPVTGEDGVSGAVILLIDETEKEQRETLRREFTANISHELKTPLTSISGFAELIKDGMAKGEDARRFAGNIYRESGRLIVLVGDIIKLSQLDSGEIPFDEAPVDLFDVAGEVLGRLENIAQHSGVSLELSGSAATVRGNRQILEEMLYNLCDNGIKYGREGGYLRVTVGSRDGHAELSVEDNGIGIPQAEQGRVFERFYRVDKSHSKEIGGTGLGLSIVKHAAAYHSAEIALASTPGIGTRITLTF